MPSVSEREFSKFIVYSRRLQRLALCGSQDMTQPQWSAVCYAALNGEPAMLLNLKSQFVNPGKGGGRHVAQAGP